MTRYRAHLIVLAALLALCLLPAPVKAECHPIPVEWYSPTGIAGCETYGTGTASRWQGPGVARNDCIWPWTDCQTIAIRSIQTGVTIVVTPTMYGDLYTGTSIERIVDLDPSAVAALGLDWDAGLWPVEVWAVDGETGMPNGPAPMALPDTAMRP